MNTQKDTSSSPALDAGADAVALLTGAPQPPDAGCASSWSAGVFHSTGTQVPGPCLRECLGGDASRAATHGCAMLRALTSQESAARDVLARNPASCCDRGHVAAVKIAPTPDEPDVLLLVDTGQQKLASRNVANRNACYLAEAQAADNRRQTTGHAAPGEQSFSDAELSAGAAAALQAAAIANWRLDQENRGLADEVLRSYEQINLIFDVSAEIAVLNDAIEVRRMLLFKLLRLFNADSVYFISAAGEVKQVLRDGTHRRGWIEAADPKIQTTAAEADSVELPPEFPAVLERLRKSRRVLVSSAGGPAALKATDSKLQPTSDQSPPFFAEGHGDSLWGPLTSTENQNAKIENQSDFSLRCSIFDFDIVGVVRRGQPFVAGDMLVLDSALVYGGNILSNLRLVEQLKRTSFEAVRALVNAIDQKDNYTYGHSERVGFLAKVTGQYLGLPARALQELEWAGLLHDVGKIGIPESVLNKPGRLTDEEFALIKEHPSRSFEVLRPVASLEPILEAVLYHHENPDGSGYPQGLKGDQIPLSAGIIHVVDVFDALTSTRSYREAFDIERALEILRKDAGTKLDAKIVDSFIKAWALLPKSHPEQHQRWFGGTGTAGPGPVPVTDRQSQTDGQSAAASSGREERS